MGLDRATNGYFYLLDSRSSGGENCLQVIDPSGPDRRSTNPAQTASTLAFPEIS